MDSNIHILPAVPMRGLAVFPYMQLNFDVARDISVKAIEAALSEESRIFLVMQKDVNVMDPTPF